MKKSPKITNVVNYSINNISQASKANFCSLVPSGQDPYEMNEILKQIEEIWGFLSVEADHVT